jgi:hypothetical protein
MVGSYRDCRVRRYYFPWKAHIPVRGKDTATRSALHDGLGPPPELLDPPLVPPEEEQAPTDSRIFHGSPFPVRRRRWNPRNIIALS